MYEYRCPANGRLVEVMHGMAEKLMSWGELCERAGIRPGTTDPASPVEKLMSAGFIGSSSSSDTCAVPGGCAGGGCGAGLCGAGDF